MYNQEFLNHVGVLGMRWGKRTKSAKPSLIGPRGNKVLLKSSEDHIKKTNLMSKKVHEMSNEQLREFTNRLQLEKQFRDLKPSKVTKGLNHVKKVTAAGTTIAGLYALSKTPLVQDLAKAVKTHMK